MIGYGLNVYSIASPKVIDLDIVRLNLLLDSLFRDLLAYELVHCEYMRPFDFIGMPLAHPPFILYVELLSSLLNARRMTVLRPFPRPLSSISTHALSSPSFTYAETSVARPTTCKNEADGIVTLKMSTKGTVRDKTNIPLDLTQGQLQWRRPGYSFPFRLDR